MRSTPSSLAASFAVLLGAPLSRGEAVVAPMDDRANNLKLSVKARIDEWEKMSTRREQPHNPLGDDEQRTPDRRLRRDDLLLMGTVTKYPTKQPTIPPTDRFDTLLQASVELPTSQRTDAPTVAGNETEYFHWEPTLHPTESPTLSPSHVPSLAPSESPSWRPSGSPSASPSAFPTADPSASPSGRPSASPTMSSEPTASPSASPSVSPTADPSASPSERPSASPSAPPTFVPTAGPSVSSKPSIAGTYPPSTSAWPSMSPTDSPTSKPTRNPTRLPTRQPTARPSASPTNSPTSKPSRHPTAPPSNAPSMHPTRNPTRKPTPQPSKSPIAEPTSLPTQKPTPKPTPQPSASPTKSPHEEPTSVPSTSTLPTIADSDSPSASSRPSRSGTYAPSASSFPTTRPSILELCPPAYNESLAATYTAGTEVEANSTVFRCNPYPFAIYCTMPSYRPEGGDGPEWKDAWEEVSGCEMPTDSPSAAPSVHDPLELCPPAYDASAAANYVEGTGVQVNGVAYRCNSYPFAIYCTLPSYRPESSDGTAWEDSWEELGPCAVRTDNPTAAPSERPTDEPTPSPTAAPSPRPTPSPSKEPSLPPTAKPTAKPTVRPTRPPSNEPTVEPSGQSNEAMDLLETVVTRPPTRKPISSPMHPSSREPTSGEPTEAPSSLSTGVPSVRPSEQASAVPSLAPSNAATNPPTKEPAPSVPSLIPSNTVTEQPTNEPSSSPAASPSASPTSKPTEEPTKQPSMSPSASPSASPTPKPSVNPSASPSASPTSNPSGSPTNEPSKSPTSNPTDPPTNEPSKKPTPQPTREPSRSPSLTPTFAPTSSPVTVQIQESHLEPVPTTSNSKKALGWSIGVMSVVIICAGCCYRSRRGKPSLFIGFEDEDEDSFHNKEIERGRGTPDRYRMEESALENGNGGPPSRIGVRMNTNSTDSEDSTVVTEYGRVGHPLSEMRGQFQSVPPCAIFETRSGYERPKTISRSESFKTATPPPSALRQPRVRSRSNPGGWGQIGSPTSTMCVEEGRPGVGVRPGRSGPPENIERTVSAPPGKLGIIIKRSPHGCVIHTVKPESPLDGKLFGGDIILKLNGDDVTGLTAQQLTILIANNIDVTKSFTVVAAKR